MGCNASKVPLQVVVGNNLDGFGRAVAILSNMNNSDNDNDMDNINNNSNDNE